MKKRISIILIFIILLCTIIAAVSPSRVQNKMPETESSEKPTTETDTINELTAFILDVDLSTSTLMIAESFDTPVEEQIRVFLKKNTEFIKYGTASDFHELSVGNQISISYKGDIVKSDTNLMHYPLRIEIDDSHVKAHTETAYIFSIHYEDHSIQIGPSKDATPEEQKRIYIKDYTRITCNTGASNFLFLSAGTWISITYSDALDDTIAVQISTDVDLDNIPATDLGIYDVIYDYLTTEYIIDINPSYNYLMIAPTMDTDYDSQTRVNISDKTAILINDTPSKIEELSIGDKISITWDGAYLETVPAQISGVSKIEVVE